MTHERGKEQRERGRKKRKKSVCVALEDKTCRASRKTVASSWKIFYFIKTHCRSGWNGRNEGSLSEDDTRNARVSATGFPRPCRCEERRRATKEKLACVQASWKHGWATDSWKNLRQCSRLVIDFTHSALLLPLPSPVPADSLCRYFRCFCTMLLHVDNPADNRRRQRLYSPARTN